MSVHAPRPILALQDMYRHLQRMVETRLWLKVLIAMFLGIGLGVVLSPDAALVPARIASPLIDWLALPGLLFVRLIQMIMIPLVVTSVIRGIVGGGDPAELKVLGPRVAQPARGVQALRETVDLGGGVRETVDERAEGGEPATHLLLGVGVAHQQAMYRSGSVIQLLV